MVNSLIFLLFPTIHIISQLLISQLGRYFGEDDGAVDFLLEVDPKISELVVTIFLTILETFFPH